LQGLLGELGSSVVDSKAGPRLSEEALRVVRQQQDKKRHDATPHEASFNRFSPASRSSKVAFPAKK